MGIRLDPCRGLSRGNALPPRAGPGQMRHFVWNHGTRAPKSPRLEGKARKKRDLAVPPVTAVPRQKYGCLGPGSLLVLPHLPRDCLTVTDKLGPSAVSAGTPRTLGRTEIFETPEDIFLPCSQSPLLSGLALQRDVLTVDKELLPVSQEQLHLQPFGRSDLILMTSY